jgi:hypothetical protein
MGHTYCFDIPGHYFIWQLLVVDPCHYSVARVGVWMSGLFHYDKQANRKWQMVLVR